MRTYDYDLFVIGAGSGGVRASRIAAKLGARVAIAEDRYLGGTCVNVGCVPKKLMYYAADFAHAFSSARGFGWHCSETTFDWPAFISRRNAEVKRLNSIYGDVLSQNGVHLIDGHARLRDPHTIEVKGRTVTADKIIVATGSWPTRPPIPGSELGSDSNELFEWQKQPRRLVIAGGGYIGVEFAGIFSGLGSQTTLIHRGPLLLRGFDEDLRVDVGNALRASGVDLRLDTTIDAIEKTADGLKAQLSDGESVTGDRFLCAVGRHPKTKGIGLIEAGVALDGNGAVVVDRHSQTSVANIYAIGDCTDRMALTPVAIVEGNAVAQTLFGGQPTSVDYHNIPTAVFSHPPIATVGLTEAEARARYAAVDVFQATFRPMLQTLAGGKLKDRYKLVVDRDSDRVVGCHLFGNDAAELIQVLGVAVKAGVTKSQFDATVAVHPTGAEELVLMR